MRIIQDMVNQEVVACASQLVARLANGYNDLNGDGPLTEQAFELSTPLPDYEGAAQDAGWKKESWGALWVIRDGREDDFTAESAEEACDIDDIEPYDREVYEHWIVSNWFAEQLEKQGEKVNHDFAGLAIWARTTTGQAIYADWVVEQVYVATHKSEGDQ